MGKEPGALKVQGCGHCGDVIVTSSTAACYRCGTVAHVSCWEREGKCPLTCCPSKIWRSKQRSRVDEDEALELRGNLEGHPNEHIFTLVFLGLFVFATTLPTIPIWPLIALMLVHAALVVSRTVSRSSRYVIDASTGCIRRHFEIFGLTAPRKWLAFSELSEIRLYSSNESLGYRKSTLSLVTSDGQVHPMQESHSCGGKDLEALAERIGQVAQTAVVLSSEDREAEPGDISAPCPVCGEDGVGGDELVFCRECNTGYHRECWNYSGRCAVYGCRSSVALVCIEDGDQSAATTPLLKKKTAAFLSLLLVGLISALGLLHSPLWIMCYFLPIIALSRSGPLRWRLSIDKKHGLLTKQLEAAGRVVGRPAPFLNLAGIRTANLRHVLDGVGQSTWSLELECTEGDTLCLPLDGDGLALAEELVRCCDVSLRVLEDENSTSPVAGLIEE